MFCQDVAADGRVGFSVVVLKVIVCAADVGTVKSGQ